jgi:predicted Rossmann-fold nucleotide-binding protein
MEERRYPTLPERIIALIEGCDAAFGLPGGPGALSEIALTWNLLQTGSIAPRPLILIGTGWLRTFDTFIACMGDNIPEEQSKLLSFAPNVQAGFNLLIENLD